MPHRSVQFTDTGEFWAGSRQLEGRPFRESLADFAAGISAAHGRPCVGIEWGDNDPDPRDAAPRVQDPPGPPIEVRPVLTEAEIRKLKAVAAREPDATS